MVEGPGRKAEDKGTKASTAKANDFMVRTKYGRKGYSQNGNADNRQYVRRIFPRNKNANKGPFLSVSAEILHQDDVKADVACHEKRSSL
jgi:hypothetical protein